MKSQGVTTQMKALDDYFLMVIFTLLLDRLHVFTVFMFNLDRETWQWNYRQLSHWVQIRKILTSPRLSGPWTSLDQRGIRPSSFRAKEWSKDNTVGRILTEKSEPLPQYGSFISRIFPEYLKNISIPRKSFPNYGIGQNNGDWIFQPYTIFYNISMLWKSFNFSSVFESSCVYKHIFVIKNLSP